MESTATGGVRGKISCGSVPAASAGPLGLREQSVQVARAATSAGSCLTRTFSKTLGDAVAAKDVFDVPEVVVIVGRVLALARLDRGLGRRRAGGLRRPGRDLPPGRPGCCGADGLLVLASLAPLSPTPPQRAGYHEQHCGQRGDRDAGPYLGREHEALREVRDGYPDFPEHLDRAGQVRG